MTEPRLARRRIVVAGMATPVSLWLAHAAVLLQRSAGVTVRAGWAHELRGGPLPEQDCVIRCAGWEPALAAGADHVLYAYRDLRDAVVAVHRVTGQPLEVSLADGLIATAREWERVATFRISQEALLADQAAGLRALATALDLPVVDPAPMLKELQVQLAKANIAAGPQHTPARAYVTTLSAGLVAEMESRHGAWLAERGYVCVTRSTFWARASDPVAARHQLWEMFQKLAEELPRHTTATLLSELQAFGAPAYQLMAVELLAALREESAVVAAAWAEILLGQRKLPAAMAKAREALRRGGPELAAELLARCEAARRAASSQAATAEAEIAGCDKTSPQSLPPVGSGAGTSSTVERLRAIVGGKVVGFLLHGSSVNGFAERAAELATEDVVWVSLNHFALLEDRFLRPAGRELSAVFCCADGEVERRLPALVSFLERPGRPLLITRPDHFARFHEALAPHRDAIALELLPPLWPYPNSLTIFLRLLVQSGARRIVLFGSDGYLGEDDISLPTYIGAEEFVREKRYSGVLLDTLLFNAHMPRVLRQWQSSLGERFPEIVNCSPGTLIQGIPTIDYCQARAALAGEPLATVPAAGRAPLPVPVATDPRDPLPDLIACMNAGRAGDLVTAQRHALRVCRNTPNRLSPFALRVLQADTRATIAAKNLLGLTGADRPESPDHARWKDFLREQNESLAAFATDRWETWA